MRASQQRRKHGRVHLKFNTRARALVYCNGRALSEKR